MQRGMEIRNEDKLRLGNRNGDRNGNRKIQKFIWLTYPDNLIPKQIPSHSAFKERPSTSQ